MHILSWLVLSWLVSLVLSCLVLSWLVSLVLSCLVLSCLVFCFRLVITNQSDDGRVSWLEDEQRASTALTAIFKDMVKAYAGQIIGTPYEFPSHHICIREPFDYYQARPGRGGRCRRRWLVDEKENN